MPRLQVVNRAMRLAMKPAFGTYVYDIDDKSQYWYNGQEWEGVLKEQIPPEANDTDLELLRRASAAIYGTGASPGSGSGGGGGGGGGAPGASNPPAILPPSPSPSQTQCSFSDNFMRTTVNSAGGTWVTERAPVGAWGCDGNDLVLTPNANLDQVDLSQALETIGPLALTFRFYVTRGTTNGRPSQFQLFAVDNYDSFIVWAGMTLAFGTIAADCGVRLGSDNTPGTYTIIGSTLGDPDGWYTAKVLIDSDAVRGKYWADGEPEPDWLGSIAHTAEAYAQLAWEMGAETGHPVKLGSVAARCLVPWSAVACIVTEDGDAIEDADGYVYELCEGSGGGGGSEAPDSGGTYSECGPVTGTLFFEDDFDRVETDPPELGGAWITEPNFPNGIDTQIDGSDALIEVDTAVSNVAIWEAPLTSTPTDGIELYVEFEVTSNMGFDFGLGQDVPDPGDVFDDDTGYYFAIEFNQADPTEALLFTGDGVGGGQLDTITIPDFTTGRRSMRLLWNPTQEEWRLKIWPTADAEPEVCNATIAADPGFDPTVTVVGVGAFTAGVGDGTGKLGHVTVRGFSTS